MPTSGSIAAPRRLQGQKEEQSASPGTQVPIPVVAAPWDAAWTTRRRPRPPPWPPRDGANAPLPKEDARETQAGALVSGKGGPGPALRPRAGGPVPGRRSLRRCFPRGLVRSLVPALGGTPPPVLRVFAGGSDLQVRRSPPRAPARGLDEHEGRRENRCSVGARADRPSARAPRKAGLRLLACCAPRGGSCLPPHLLPPATQGDTAHGLVQPWGRATSA